MAFESSTAFDAGPPVISGSKAWLAWHAENAKRDGILAGQFSVRSGGARDVIDLSEAAGGVCFDWPTSLIGWQLPGEPGVAPQRLWSTTRAKMPPCPGEGWKRAFWAQLCAFIDGRPMRLIWEATQVASWLGYRDAMVRLAASAAAELPKLPLFAFTDHTPAMVPQFRVLRFVPRPACLPEDPQEPHQEPHQSGAHAGNGSNGNGQAVSPAWDQRPPAGRPGARPGGGAGVLDDDIPF
jgi:hypothetical protein